MLYFWKFLTQNSHILKYGLPINILSHLRRCAADAFKTSSKRVTQNTAEATGDSIGNRIVNKMAKVSKNYNKLI